MFAFGGGLQGALVGGHEVEVVAEAFAAAHVAGAAVHRHHDRQIEGHLATVVTDELGTRAVDIGADDCLSNDMAGVELGDQVHALLLQQRCKGCRGDGLGDRTVERGGVGDLHLVADAALGEVPVGQEAELQRSDRALDRHVDDVDDQLAALEVGQGGLQCGGPGDVVEGEHLLVPAGAGQALRLVERKDRARRDHQHVVGDLAAVTEDHRIGMDVDPIDRLLDELDVAVQLILARPHDLLLVREPEGHEQQAGLIDVVVVLIDDHDLHRLVFRAVMTEVAVQPVGSECAARATAEDDDSLAHQSRPFGSHGAPVIPLGVEPNSMCDGCQLDVRPTACRAQP